MPLQRNLLVDYEMEERKLYHRLAMLHELRKLDILTGPSTKEYSPLELMGFERSALAAMTNLVTNPGCSSFVDEHKEALRIIRIRISKDKKSFVKIEQWAELFGKIDELLGTSWYTAETAPVAG